MHSLKRILPALIALFVLSAFAAYANGQGESRSLSGTVTKITPPTANGQVTVVLSGTGGTYSIAVDQSVVAASGLRVGNQINIKGSIQNGSDGTKRVKAIEVNVNGHQFTISPGSTSGPNGVGYTTASVSPDQNSTHGSAEVEKSDNASSGGSSKDTETPDKSANSSKDS